MRPIEHAAIGKTRPSAVTARATSSAEARRAKEDRGRDLLYYRQGALRYRITLRPWTLEEMGCVQAFLGRDLGPTPDDTRWQAR
jgi:hypothetical protein